MIFTVPRCGIHELLLRVLPRLHTPNKPLRAALRAALTLQEVGVVRTVVVTRVSEALRVAPLQTQGMMAALRVAPSHVQVPELQIQASPEVNPVLIPRVGCPAMPERLPRAAHGTARRMEFGERMELPRRLRQLR